MDWVIVGAFEKVSRFGRTGLHARPDKYLSIRLPSLSDNVDIVAWFSYRHSLV